MGGLLTKNLLPEVSHIRFRGWEQLAIVHEIGSRAIQNAHVCRAELLPSGAGTQQPDNIEHRIGVSRGAGVRPGEGPRIGRVVGVNPFGAVPVTELPDVVVSEFF